MPQHSETSPAAEPAVESLPQVEVSATDAEAVRGGMMSVVLQEAADLVTGGATSGGSSTSSSAPTYSTIDGKPTSACSIPSSGAATKI